MTEDAMQEIPQPVSREDTTRAMRQDFADRDAEARKPLVEPEMLKTPGELEMTVGQPITAEHLAEMKAIMGQSNKDQSNRDRSQNALDKLRERVEANTLAASYAPPVQAPVAQAAPAAPAAPAVDPMAAQTAALTAATGDEGMATAISSALEMQQAKFMELLTPLQERLAAIDNQAAQQNGAAQFEDFVTQSVANDDQAAFLDAGKIHSLARTWMNQDPSLNAVDAYGKSRDAHLAHVLQQSQSSAGGQNGTTPPPGPSGTATGLPATVKSVPNALGTHLATQTSRQVEDAWL